MTRIFNEDGLRSLLRSYRLGRALSRRLKPKKDGYEAIQVGYLNREPKHTSKPMQGHFDRSGVRPKKVLLEFEKVPGFDYKVGQSFHVGIFNQGDIVRISGKSKGKGFTGVIKRHNFARQKKTHGQGILRGRRDPLVKLQIPQGYFQE